MTPPYTFRIMAALPGHDPVELFRSLRTYAQADWDHWTRDLSPEWTCWVEHRLHDKHTLTPRIFPHRGAGRVDRLPLTHEERSALRVGPELQFNP